MAFLFRLSPFPPAPSFVPIQPSILAGLLDTTLDTTLSSVNVGQTLKSLLLTSLTRYRYVDNALPGLGLENRPRSPKIRGQ